MPASPPAGFDSAPCRPLEWLRPGDQRSLARPARPALPRPPPLPPGRWKTGRPAPRTASDLQTVQHWIEARAGATAKVYQREAYRLLLWLQYESLESQGATLTQMQLTDCIASMGGFTKYFASLDLPRSRLTRPKRLGAVSRTVAYASSSQTVAVIASLFAWLQAAQYLKANPWVLVN